MNEKLSPAFSVDDLIYVRNGRALVDRVSLEIPEGSMMAVIGPNGAGKTTLLRLLAGVLSPSSGRVHVFGQDLALQARRQIAQQLAHVPQDTSSQFDIGVRDAVALGRFSYVGIWQPFGSHDWDIVDASIADMELTHLADRRLPSLSGGERQRVYLARALAQESSILLADEPTSALDVGHQLALIDKLTELNAAGRTIVVAMHDLPLCWNHFERAILLADGRLVSDGRAKEVLSETVASEVFGVHFTSHEDRLFIER